jgi:hypothetical protein
MLMLWDKGSLRCDARTQQICKSSVTQFKSRTALP